MLAEAEAAHRAASYKGGKARGLAALKARVTECVLAWLAENWPLDYYPEERATILAKAVPHAVAAYDELKAKKLAARKYTCFNQSDVDCACEAGVRFAMTQLYQIPEIKEKRERERK